MPPSGLHDTVLVKVVDTRAVRISSPSDRTYAGIGVEEICIPVYRLKAVQHSPSRAVKIAGGVEVPQTAVDRLPSEHCLPACAVPHSGCVKVKCVSLYLLKPKRHFSGRWIEVMAC